MSRFEQVEILLVEDSALDVERTVRAPRNGRPAHRQSYDIGANGCCRVKPAGFNALAELARQAGCHRLAINRTPTP